PQVLPLQPDDRFFERHITYIYRENSLYNRRYLQRQRMKQLLGRTHRPLVELAQRSTKAWFLEHLSEPQARAIQQRLQTDPGRFWRAAHGKVFLDLPAPWRQLMLPFADDPSDSIE
ncbi:MAG: hypothetical protein ACK5Q5_19250, partial [Planctomycetaceae bacterium]